METEGLIGVFSTLPPRNIILTQVNLVHIATPYFLKISLALFSYLCHVSQLISCISILQVKFCMHSELNFSDYPNFNKNIGPSLDPILS
jgi:hypothetical protein